MLFFDFMPSTCASFNSSGIYPLLVIMIRKWVNLPCALGLRFGIEMINSEATHYSIGQKCSARELRRCRVCVRSRLIGAHLIENRGIQIVNYTKAWFQLSTCDCQLLWSVGASMKYLLLYMFPDSVTTERRCCPGTPAKKYGRACLCRAGPRKTVLSSVAGGSLPPGDPTIGSCRGYIPPSQVRPDNSMASIKVVRRAQGHHPAGATAHSNVERTRNPSAVPRIFPLIRMANRPPGDIHILGPTCSSCSRGIAESVRWEVEGSCIDSRLNDNEECRPYSCRSVHSSRKRRSG